MCRIHLIGSELSIRHLNAHLLKLLLLLHVRHLHLLFLFSLFTAPHVCLLHLSFRALFATYLNIHFIVFSALIVLLKRFFVIVAYSFLFL